MPDESMRNSDGEPMSEEPSIDKVLMALKLVWAFMAAGVILFLIGVMALGGNRPSDPALARPLVFVVLGAAVVATLLPMVLYKLLMNQARVALAKAPANTAGAQIVAGRLIAYTLISLGAAEALGFVAATGYWFTQERTGLFGAGLSILLMVRQFPTRGSYEQFLADAESPG